MCDVRLIPQCEFNYMSKTVTNLEGPARTRTGVIGIRIQCDNLYTTEPHFTTLREF